MGGALTYRLGLVGIGTSPGLPAPNPPFANVMWLSGFEGTDASTTIPYEGHIAGITVTANGNAQIDTGQKKFGSSSLQLDGNGDYVSSADNNNWTPSTGGFCAEAWIRFDPGANLSLNHTIMSQYNATGGHRSWIFSYFGTAGELRFYATNNESSITLQVGYAWVPSTGVWYHVAAERSSLAPGTYRLYIDGAKVAKTTSGLATAIANTAAPFQVGATATPSDYFHGWIDEARFTNGLSVYETDGTFTVPAAAFPRS